MNAAKYDHLDSPKMQVAVSIVSRGLRGNQLICWSVQECNYNYFLDNEEISPAEKYFKASF